MKENVEEILNKVREEKPLVHHITNWVTIYDCANIVKVLGASPVMAHAKEEVEDMTSIASALVLNIGTLTEDLVIAMKLAAKCANKKGIPVILDVCGAGSTKFRDKICLEILKDVTINIVKGNASEIARIAGEDVLTKGVDSIALEKNMSKVAKGLAKDRKCIVVITGQEDIVTDGNEIVLVRNGHPIMENFVGSGCMATSVIATFAAVERDLLAAAAAGLACYEIAAEIAANTCQGPGSFKERLFDTIYSLDSKTVNKMKRIEE